MVASSWNQVVANPLSSTSSTVATIHLWISQKVGNSFTPFTGNIDLTSLETTGSLKTALKYAQAKPGVAFRYSSYIRSCLCYLECSKLHGMAI